jgi:hypothetical protein
MAALGAIAAPWAVARKFYADDPLWRDPDPIPVEMPRTRRPNEYYDFARNTFFEPTRENKPRTPRPTAAVNTLGEVPDSGWFTNRMGVRPMSIAELVRGPGDETPPAPGPWTVLGAKSEGITPGLTIEDSKGERYLIKFDPLDHPEMASAADVIGSKFFHALGYNVPENYLVWFTDDQLVLTEQTKFKDKRGRPRRMEQPDLEALLRKTPRGADGRRRVIASRFIGGHLIGPFKFHSTRRDDPNDVVPHEDRRDLRGLYVFAAWLNHTDSKSLNTLDSIVEENGVHFIRHYLLDFGAILGSDSFTAKSPRAGNVYLLEGKAALWQLVSLGLYVPDWMRADYPDIPSVGRLEWKTFDPRNWRSNYPNPAFDSRGPGDEYWAAKKVMAFSDEAIRAIVGTGRYSDPRASEWITRAVIERRNRIGREYVCGSMLPLDDFRVSGGELRFDDLAVRYGFEQPRQFTVAWSVFDNESERKSPIAGATGWEVPTSPAEYLAADIRGADPGRSVTVYLRGDRVVGIDRTWPAAVVQ